MAKSDKPFDPSDLIGGTLDILGLKIDLAKLLSSSEDVSAELQGLREKLKKAGGKEALSDAEWREGAASVSGRFRTHGVLGEREYHIGTAGSATRGKGRESTSKPAEAVEPPVDVFQEAQEVVVVAEVPGVEIADIELKVEGNTLSLSTKPTSRRSYRKEVNLGSSVDAESLSATCRNGILEIHLRKAGS